MNQVANQAQRGHLVSALLSWYWECPDALRSISGSGLVLKTTWEP